MIKSDVKYVWDIEEIERVRPGEFDSEFYDYLDNNFLKFIHLNNQESYTRIKSGTKLWYRLGPIERQGVLKIEN